MSFEPFRSVVIPKGKMGSGFDPNAPADPAGARATRTIILEGPALDPDAISAAPARATRATTVTRPAALAGSLAGAPAPGTTDAAAEESGEVYVVDASAGPGGGESGAPARAPRPRGERPQETAAPAAQRQYVVAYDGRLVGTYRCAKRIQNRTAYLKVAEQLVGQIEEFDPARIRLYRLIEVPVAEPVHREEIGESFHNFPRDDVPAPDA